MTSELHDVIKSYIIKNPTLNFTEIADLIVEDDASTKAHRTLRRYVGEVFAEMQDAQLPTDSDVTQYIDVTSSSFDIVPDSEEPVNGESEDPGPEEAEPEAEPKIKRVPKILVLDIETARMIVGVWNIGFKVNIGPEQIIKDWFIYGYAAKWLFGATTVSDFVTPEEALKRDDKRICQSLWILMDEADIIITHNGNRFDLPKINTRFFLNGLSPVSPYHSLDTCRIVSKDFGFSSNSLNYIGKIAIHREKVNTTYRLWIECEQGVAEALAYMEHYCQEDVNLLEEVYVAIRPWIKGHPNLAVLMNTDDATCPNCGGTEFEPAGSYYTTQQNAYNSVRCTKCGAVNRTKISVISSELRHSMVVPAAH